MNRHHMNTVREIFISSIFGLAMGFGPWYLLALLMQGLGETLGVLTAISTIAGGTLFPLKIFRQHMRQYANGDIATQVLAFFMVVGIPVAGILLPEALPTLPGSWLPTIVRVLGITLVPPVGAALVIAGMSHFGFNPSEQEAETEDA